MSARDPRASPGCVAGVIWPGTARQRTRTRAWLADVVVLELELSGMSSRRWTASTNRCLADRRARRAPALAAVELRAEPAPGCRGGSLGRLQQARSEHVNAWRRRPDGVAVVWAARVGGGVDGRHRRLSQASQTGARRAEKPLPSRRSALRRAKWRDVTCKAFNLPAKR